MRTPSRSLTGRRRARRGGAGVSVGVGVGVGGPVWVGVGVWLGAGVKVGSGVRVAVVVGVAVFVAVAVAVGVCVAVAVLSDWISGSVIGPKTGLARKPETGVLVGRAITGVAVEAGAGRTPPLWEQAERRSRRRMASVSR